MHLIYSLFEVIGSEVQITFPAQISIAAPLQKIQKTLRINEIIRDLLLKKNGSLGRARTADPVINSHLLYR